MDVYGKNPPAPGAFLRLHTNLFLSDGERAKDDSFDRE